MCWPFIGLLVRWLIKGGPLEGPLRPGAIPHDQLTRSPRKLRSGPPHLRGSRDRRSRHLRGGEVRRVPDWWAGHPSEASRAVACVRGHGCAACRRRDRVDGRLCRRAVTALRKKPTRTLTPSCRPAHLAHHESWSHHEEASRSRRSVVRRADGRRRRVGSAEFERRAHRRRVDHLQRHGRHRCHVPRDVSGRIAALAARG
jgi:hypothetical protein